MNEAPCNHEGPSPPSSSARDVVGTSSTINARSGRRPRLEARPAYQPTCDIRGLDLQRQQYVDSRRRLCANTGRSPTLGEQIISTIAALQFVLGVGFIQ